MIGLYVVNDFYPFISVSICDNRTSPRPKLKSKGPSQQMITDHLLLCTTHNLVLGRPNAARNPSNLARQRYVSLALFFYLARSATCTAFVTILI